ncbi:C40 family peptidase [Demequina lutea]|uniref:Cell wall-associated NlpC family hydrolase n=1 Tax=Demequina lutea TaxID=431489 RepID=A0A7Z0CJ51_9MICO|nr:C40 family peptidase [Demequina lutea]NYI40573.1 cell wall-associated NlpC family hydrolase [Demequina lutea]
MAVSIGAALVVVPLSGAAAVAISGSNSPTPDAAAVAIQGTKYVSEVAQIGAPVAAKADASFQVETPALTVTVNPKPVVVYRPRVSARTVANSADVAQAIAGSSIIAEASKYVGIAYRSGGSSPSTGFDCSGFVKYVYAQFGISLPRVTGEYFGVGTRVNSPQPGDIIVTPGHVGIYAGPNLQIDSPRPGKTIQFRAIWQVNPVYIRVTG